MLGKKERCLEGVENQATFRFQALLPLCFQFFLTSLILKIAWEIWLFSTRVDISEKDFVFFS
jgi:hypothetical protein